MCFGKILFLLKISKNVVNKIFQRYFDINIPHCLLKSLDVLIADKKKKDIMAITES